MELSCTDQRRVLETTVCRAHSVVFRHSWSWHDGNVCLKNSSVSLPTTLWQFVYRYMKILLLILSPVWPNTQFTVCYWIWVFTARDPFVCLCQQPLIIVDAGSGHIINDLKRVAWLDKSHFLLRRMDWQTGMRHLPKGTFPPGCIVGCT